ncbi:MAG: serine hydrolase domain-containing protein [Halobacteriales archaeon]
MATIPDATLDRLRALFDRQLDAGVHHGAQLTVYADGEQLINYAGGTNRPDGESTTPAQRHVLFSCTKPYAGVCLHQLVDDNAMEYDDRVIDHWPEFAPADSPKAAVTVRHVLSHQSGLPTGPIDDDPAQWTDWSTAVTAMERAELDFEPGTTAAYHALNYGWLVGELVRRVSGTPIDEHARKNIFEPLGMADTTIGLGDADPDTVATLVGFEAFDRCREPGVGLEDSDNEEAATLFNRPTIQRAVIPAATGIGTARDMARFYACLANDGILDDTRILSTDAARALRTEQIAVDRDGTLGIPRRYGLGVELAGTAWDKYGSISPRRVFGHGGLGSIVGWGDPEADIGFAYVTNGIRTEYEHGSRVNAMADAVRTVLN